MRDQSYRVWPGRPLSDDCPEPIPDGVTMPQDLYEHWEDELPRLLYRAIDKGETARTFNDLRMIGVMLRSIAAQLDRSCDAREARMRDDIQTHHLRRWAAQESWLGTAVIPYDPRAGKLVPVSTEL